MLYTSRSLILCATLFASLLAGCPGVDGPGDAPPKPILPEPSDIPAGTYSGSLEVSVTVEEDGVPATLGRNLNAEGVMAASPGLSQRAGATLGKMSPNASYPNRVVAPLALTPPLQPQVEDLAWAGLKPQAIFYRER